MYYFAYGSNMCTARLARRVPSVAPVGPAWLSGHRLHWHLVGNDGSGKCNVVETGDPGDRVYGVLFELDPARLDRLHAAEGPAYDFLELTTGHATGQATAAIYRGRADWLDDALTPFDWYRDFVVTGAAEHGLPPHWIDGLAKVPTVPDPNAERAAENRVILDEIPANVTSAIR
ncbi:gamma-glutamylcyclotransferase family protein [Salinisphaera hydrothermalis]|uniref:AIG2 family protein n=1 Tax=Salinisphaera hydrothermalis (strain C41B8) TaxID=1304275 RepID=A0A084II80_SALHC|nr:gamma-glutamylcyclotransferase family protein [Salinisphaera hydrothermalis]KEZ76414.1 AIG2 family protein [Salinisphaera hydrothermalis C41B8]